MRLLRFAVLIFVLTGCAAPSVERWSDALAWPDGSSAQDAAIRKAAAKDPFPAAGPSLAAKSSK